MLRGLALSVAFAIAAIATCVGSAATTRTITVSSKHHVFSAVVTRPDPIPVEQLHVWRVRLFDRRHRAVSRAKIRVSGDMPAHGHGMPTEPVARARGRGLYELEGMMFQMPGRWYVQLDVRSAGRHDTIRIRFTIAE
jgi:hypothetical protein